MAMTRILGMGNALVDIMIRIDSERIFQEFDLLKGGMRLVDASFIDRLMSALTHLPQEKTPGGSAANAINGLANLGIKTGFIGKVADDDLGKFMKSDMMKNNIEPVLFQGNAATGIAVALITPDYERTFAVNLGCAIELSAGDVSRQMFEGYDIFHIEGFLVQNKELLVTAMQMAKTAGAKVSLDLASFDVVQDNLDFLKEVIMNYVDIVFANEEEARSFTGLEPEKALDEISKMTAYAVVKIGDKGSLLKHGDETCRIPATEANIIDTTGAGDLYASGFLYGLAENLPLQTCGNIGALLAGNVIEVMGAKMDEKRWENIRQLVQNIR